MFTKKRWLVLTVLLLILAATITACERSYSEAPLTLATPTGDSLFPAPLPTSDDPMAMLEQFATQTAIALQDGEADETGTPEEGDTPEITFTPGPDLPTLTPTLPSGSFITSTPSRPATYVLQKGEFPYCIARRFNVNPDELLTLNGISPTQASSLQPGRLLQIPQTGNPFPGDRALRPHPATFTVTSSEQTIYGAACYYGDVEPLDIAVFNNLTAPYTLSAGQVLNIP
jgi:LysM repeat protein